MSKPVKIYDETFTARNFNTTPLTISDLLGDVYDYTIIIKTDVSSGDSNMRLRFNGDTGSNYRNYYMQGISSTASASVVDTDTSMQFNNGFGDTSQGLFIGHLSGLSGDERYMRAQFLGDSKISVNVAYWKNTADEITSVEISGASSATCDALIIIYRTLKEASHDWELISTDTVNQVISASVPYVVSSTLDLDVDEKYRVVIEDANLSVSVLFIRFNSDIGNNYDNQILRNIGSIVSSNVSNYFAVYPTGYNNFKDLDFIVEGDSSDKRLISGQVLRSVTAVQIAFSAWWGNTVDNLTAIQLYSDTTSTFTGHVKLYRKKNKSSDPFSLPFKVVEEVAVSGDFSAGHTFSNLLGDSTSLYKISGLFSTLGNGLQMQINGNTGSVYTHQTLKGVGATASALTATTTFALLSDASVSKVASFDLYIYPKSGNQRPCLLKLGHGEDSIEFKAFWYTETATEITSIKVFASSTGTCTGNLTIQRLG